MAPLSNLFKRSEIFQKEFDKLFPANTFNKVNILRYITACIETVLGTAREKYPEHGLRFINPLFIVDDEIFPAAHLPGDNAILRFAAPVFDLVTTKHIIPLSIPVVRNLLPGICLMYGNTAGEYDYKLFKTFNLDILPGLESKPGAAHEANIADEIKRLIIQVHKYPASFVALADALSVATDEEKITLIKTLILYKSMASVLEKSMVFSFVNKYNLSHSFFDCLLTFISDRPFDEDDLLDFAHITESIALPIATFDFNMSKGISAHTMGKRSSLKNVLLDTFKHVI